MTEARRLLERLVAFADKKVDGLKVTNYQIYTQAGQQLVDEVRAYLAAPMTTLTDEEQGWYDRCESSVEDWPSDDSDTVEAMARHLRSLAESRAREGELVAALERIKTGRMDIGGKDEAMPRAVMMSEALAALAQGKAHVHEWIDARNEVVKSGEMCLCGAIRAGRARD